MPLSGDQKMLRRKIVADAVRRLRTHLGVTQNELGRMIDTAGAAERRATTDGGSVHRWETGDTLPNEWKRRELIRLAQKAGRHDLAALIEEPIRNWRQAVRAKDDALFRLLTIIEICALNDDDVGRFDEETEQHMLELAIHMKRHAPERPPILPEDYHRQVWLEMDDYLEERRAWYEARAQKANSLRERTTVIREGGGMTNRERHEWFEAMAKENAAGMCGQGSDGEKNKSEG
jgi:hypothetical protein